MATTTRVLTASVNGTVYTTNANGALEAIDTCHSGATAPTNEVANGKLWLDTTTTPGILKMYNNAAWEEIGGSTSSPTFVAVNAGDVNITGPTPILTLTDNDIADEYTKIQNAGGGTYIDSRNGTFNGAIIFRGFGGGVTDEFARFNASGNFGIGDGAPSEALSVTGNIATTGTVTASGITVDNTNPSIKSADADGFLTLSGGTGTAIGTQIRLYGESHATAANDITFRSGNSARLIYNASTPVWNFQAEDILTTGTVTAAGADLTGPLTSTGNFTITNGAPKLTFSDTDGTNQAGSVQQQGASLLFRSRNDTADGQFLFQGYGAASSTEFMRIDSSGNVGIGDAAPAEALSVTGNIAATGTVVTQDEVRAEVIEYLADQDAPYMIAASTSYTGATTDWGTHGFQHRFKSDGAGLPRVTVDSNAGELYSLNNRGEATFASFITSDTGLIVGTDIAAGAVGSYAFLTRNTAYVVFGSTYGGGGLRPAGLSSTAILSTTTAFYHDDESADLYVGPGTDTATTPGTWRCMGQTTADIDMDRGVTLFLRIL